MNRLPEETHECPESKGRKMSWDLLCSGFVKISTGADGVWFCEGGDASMRIAFCPFCGKKLGELPPPVAQ